MALQTALQATGLELVLCVEGYEFPQYDTGWDANALICEIELDVDRLGRFHASHRLVIYTVELEQFADQLRALDPGSSRQAMLEHGADEIGLTISLNAGTGTLDGFLADSTAGRLSFANIDIDQAFVEQTLEQLDELVNTFPARGSLHD